MLAEETGGIAVVNQNDFDKALKRIDAETSDYYVLGYYSSNPDPLKRTRKIDVKILNRPNVNAFFRSSYSLRPPPPPDSAKLVVRSCSRSSDSHSHSPTNRRQSEPNHRPTNLPTTNQA